MGYEGQEDASFDIIYLFWGRGAAGADLLWRTKRREAFLKGQRVRTCGRGGGRKAGL